MRFKGHAVWIILEAKLSWWFCNCRMNKELVGTEIKPVSNGFLWWLEVKLAPVRLEHLHYSLLTDVGGGGIRLLCWSGGNMFLFIWSPKFSYQPNPNMVGVQRDVRSQNDLFNQCICLIRYIWVELIFFLAKKYVETASIVHHVD